MARLDEALRRKYESIWLRLVEHPFVIELYSGRLPMEKFRFYLIQDYHYLLSVMRAFALLASKADIETARLALEIAYEDAVIELENYKRLREQETKQLVEYANEQILRELIPVLDHLQLATQVEGDAASIKKGVEMVLRDFIKVLEKFGVKRVESEGREFDPRFHEAIEKVETDDAPDGYVVKEHQAGYILKGKLIRPARVSVAKNKEKKEG